MNHNNTHVRFDKKITYVVIDKADSIVAISGLFANIGVFGITLRKMNTPHVIYSSTSTSVSTPTQNLPADNGYLGTGIYTSLILFALLVTYGLWKFRSWGWLVTVLFSVVCILLVVPDILNYHAALVSMILLSYITQPSVRNKYVN